MKTELLYGYRTIKRITAISAQQRIQSEYLKTSYRKYLFNYARKNIIIKYLYTLEIFRIFIFTVLKNDANGSDKELIYFAATNNQMRQIDYIKSLYLSDKNYLTLDMRTNKKISFKNFFKMLICMNFFFVLTRYSRILCRHDDAIEMKNIILYLCAYKYATSFLKRHKPCVVVVANDHSPLPLGFAGAARTLGIKTIYIQHAHVTNDLPALRVNLAILDGPSAYDTYAAVGDIPAQTRIIFRGLEGQERPMYLDKIDGIQKITAGLFVNIFDNGALSNTVSDILSHSYIEKLILREHPAFPIDASKFKFDNRVCVSKSGTPLCEDAQKCDIIFGGNSSFHLSVLKFGVPSVFYDALDYINYDDYGFRRHDIVFETKNLRTLDLNDVKRYYEDVAWPSRFRYFDASYQKDITVFNEDVRNTLRDFISSDCKKLG
jgi:hypothetical protein